MAADEPTVVSRINLERNFVLTPERRTRLARILQREISEASSARWPQEQR